MSEDANCPACGYIGKGVDFAYHGCLSVLRQRIAALEAEKAERERQDPVAWVLFDDIFIAPKDMQDDPPNLECMKPLYAHPLALREPTEDECVALACRVDELLGDPSRQTDAEYGRAMWQAVREVMTK